MHVCAFIYRLHNTYTQYTHILCKQTLLFWMRLIVINHLTALTEIQGTTVLNYYISHMTQLEKYIIEMVHGAILQSEFNVWIVNKSSQIFSLKRLMSIWSELKIWLIR